MINPLRVHGKLFGLNRALDLGTLWYNRHLFDEGGLKPPEETWTWETLVDRAQRLTRREGVRPQFGFATNGFGSKVWLAAAAQSGTRLVDRDVLPARLHLDRAPLAEAFQWLADLRHRWRVTPTDDEYREHGNAVQLFQTGRLAMLFAEATSAPRFATLIKDFAYDVAVPARGKQLGTWMWGAGYTVPRAGPQREAAVQFLRYTGGVEGQQAVARHQQGLPTIKQVLDSDLFLKSGPPQNRKAWRQSFDWGVTLPVTPTWPEIEGVLTKELAATWSGTRTARESLAAARPPVEQYFKQADDLVRQMPP